MIVLLALAIPVVVQKSLIYEKAFVRRLQIFIGVTKGLRRQARSPFGRRSRSRAVHENLRMALTFLA